MWTRALLKNNAKQALRGKYGRALLLCFLLGLLDIGDVAPQMTVQYRENMQIIRELTTPQVWTGNQTAADNTIAELFAEEPAIFGVLAVVVLVGAVINFCWGVFVTNPLSVGRNRYFMENRQGLSPLSTVLTIFKTPYLNVVKVCLLTSLKIFLGSLIVVPGIYWSYCYRQVPYLLAENPYMTTARAMELSKQMMEGEKWNTFVLELSFFGWMLLCAFTFGIGFLFLEPYMQATYAELYAALRAKVLAEGDTDSSELGGFVTH